MSTFGKSIITDSQGHDVEVGLFGAMKITEPDSQISAVFNAALEPRDYVQIIEGSGHLTPRYNRSMLKVGSAGIGLADITTTKHLRYRTGSTIETTFTAGWIGNYESANAADVAFMGLFDDYDGVFMGYKGQSFIVGYRNVFADNGVGNEPDVTEIIAPDWDVTRVHRYRIRFAYLGVGNITFEYHNGKAWVHIHTFMTDGTLTDRTHVGGAILPMRCKVDITAGNTAYIATASWNGATYSKNNYIQDHPHYVEGVDTIVPGAVEKAILAIRSSTTYVGFPNKISSQLLTAEFATASEGLYRVKVYGYPPGGVITDLPGVSYTDLFPGTSPLQADKTVANTEVASITGELMFGTFIAVPSSGTGVAKSTADFERIQMVANPGNEFLITLEQIHAGAGTDTFAYGMLYADLG